MGRVLGAVAILLLVAGCSHDAAPSPTAPTPRPTAAAARITITPNALQLPAGGGSVDLVIETAANEGGGTVAPNIPIALSTTSGTLSDTATTTDWTGHAKVTWTGTTGATITAHAGELVATATFAVQKAPDPIPPPTPGPSPQPTPAPQPTPPTPPAPPSPVPQPKPAGDLIGAITLSPAAPEANQPIAFSAGLASTTGAPVPAIAAYTWDLNGDRLPDHFEPTPSASFPAGTVTTLLEIITADGRAVDTALTFTVGETPALAATLAATPSSAQLGEMVTLTATVTPTGNVGTLSYGWDVDGNGTIDQTTPTNTTSTNYSTVGTKLPKVTVSSSRGPKATASTSVSVTGPALAASLSASSPRVVGSTVTFASTVTSAGTVPSGLSFAWDFDGNGTVDALSTGSPSSSAGYTFNAAGSYTAKVTVTAPDGRTATNTLTIVVN